MSIFAFYYVSGLLRHIGWPRKRGLLRREVYDTTILDSAVDQMIDWSAALGAGRPQLALQMIAEMFNDRNWEGADAPNIRQFIERAKQSKAVDGCPHEIVERPRFAKSAGTVPAKDLFDPRLRVPLEKFCLFGILYGLSDPARFERWYRASRQRHETELPLMREVGLATDSLPELAEFLTGAEDILRDYEREVGSLPPIPRRLLADARAIGRTDV